MEGSHEDFTLHIEWRHSFRNQTIAKVAISGNFLICFLKPLKKKKIEKTFILSVKGAKIFKNEIKNKNTK